MASSVEKKEVDWSEHPLLCPHQITPSYVPIRTPLLCPHQITPSMSPSEPPPMYSSEHPHVCHCLFYVFLWFFFQTESQVTVPCGLQPLFFCLIFLNDRITAVASSSSQCLPSLDQTWAQLLQGKHSHLEAFGKIKDLRCPPVSHRGLLQKQA